VLPNPLRHPERFYVPAIHDPNWHSRWTSAKIDSRPSPRSLRQSRGIRKQTQTNPLRLNILKSENYSGNSQNKPIDVKLNHFSRLSGKMACFLQNLDGTRLTAGFASPGELPLKKQTQTNPLWLSVSESAKYPEIGQNKPIEAKLNYFNRLAGKIARFLQNLDETRVTAGFASPGELPFKKQTQTNPFGLSVSESSKYAEIGQNKPIVAKLNHFKRLAGKKVRFLQNLDETWIRMQNPTRAN
jgi:hypothetical protein